MHCMLHVQLTEVSWVLAVNPCLQVIGYTANVHQQSMSMLIYVYTVPTHPPPLQCSATTYWHCGLVQLERVNISGQLLSNSQSGLDRSQLSSEILPDLGRRSTAAVISLYARVYVVCVCVCVCVCMHSTIHTALYLVLYRNAQVGREKSDIGQSTRCNCQVVICATWVGSSQSTTKVSEGCVLLLVAEWLLAETTRKKSWEVSFPNGMVCTPVAHLSNIIVL